MPSSVTGHIVIADIVVEQGWNRGEVIRETKQYALEHLQKWEVPRIINVVNGMDSSHTGKQVRTYADYRNGSL